MIEDIKELRPKLHSQTLHRHKIFDNRDIEGLEARSQNHITPHHTLISEGRFGKCRWVIPQIGTRIRELPGSSSEIPTLGNIRSAVTNIGARWSEVKPRKQCNQRFDLPVSERAGEESSSAQPLLPASKRQFIPHAFRGAITLIVAGQTPVELEIGCIGGIIGFHFPRTVIFVL